ncbi:MAG: permease-like cell division protein FtsX [Oscillospiraceae bacterium]|nr:permease-like cell division protein FtsX [Oscillospiraceae bacterium]
MRTSNVTYLVKKGISSVWKNFVMSFASFSILMVSLLLVSCAVLLMVNVNIVMGNIEDTNEIAIYLEEGVTETQISHILDVLSKNSDLTDIQYHSKEEALEDFRDSIPDQAELLDYLEENPMPETFFVRVTDLTKIRHVVNVISSIDGVEKVKAPYDFAGVLVNIRNTFTVIATAVLIALVVVSVVIVSNAIRTSVFARRNEINIMKYVGATNGFIKAPFFVEGMFIGILAGAAAWGLTWLVYDSVFSLFSEDMTLWQMFGFFDLIPFNDIMWTVLAVNCVAGALLGAVGTVISTGKHLKV